MILPESANIIWLLLGTTLAVDWIAHSRWLRWLTQIYIDVFRGLLEEVIIIRLGIGPLVSRLTNNNTYPFGIAALEAMAAAHISEILRSDLATLSRCE
ncbi:hypothetical protein [Mycobacterium leprae]|uniref:hypothetical protein n=1 Tax=Mycobacterium leprae TaxID=1769 RepID=UPI000AB5FA49|nr:hypothetical protein [Mycobacterium leprae]